MKIDWFTVIAQVVNFLILAGLLWRFLYKPILKAIDEREKKIAAQLADAEAKKAEANKEQEDFKQKNEAFDKEKKDLTDKAVAESQEERKKLLDQARTDAATLSTKLDEASKEAQVNLNHEIAQSTRQQVFAITRKALTDLASVGLEEQSANMFIGKLKALNEDEKKQFTDAFKVNTNPILVRSAFDLPVKQQDEIKDTVNRILSAAPQFQFKTNPELISGIEISSNGYKMAWSISEYLDSLEKSIPVIEKETTAAQPEKK